MGFYGGLLGSNGNLASGKRLHSELENYHFESVNQLFLWAIFNSYVTITREYMYFTDLICLINPAGWRAI